MRRLLFIVTLLAIGTLPLTAGSLRLSTSTANASAGSQGQATDDMRDAPPDLTPYTRSAIPADRTHILVQPSLPLTAPAIRVIDTVINNTNTNLTNTDTFNDGEPSIAINPANPKEIVITAFSGSWGANAPEWESTDRGNTWTKQFTVPAPPMVPSAINCPCDQAVDFDRNNNLAGTFLTFTPTDDYTGLTANPASSPSWNWLLSGGVAQKTNSAGAGNIDQPWLLVDRDTAVASQDNTYVAYDDFNGAPDMHVAVSLGSDPPNFVRDNISGFSGGGGINPGHRLAVDPNNGFVYSLFQQRAGSGAGGSQNIKYMLNRSTDSGQTWTLNGSGTGIQVANADSTQPTPKFGTCNALLGGVLHAAVDPTTGDLFYVYGNRDSGSGNNRLSIIRLTSDGMGGLTLGAPVFVTGQVQAALPSVAVASDGTVGVLYDTYDGIVSGFPQFTAHFAISTDHGASFSDNTLLTFLSVANDNGNARQRVLGDYQQVKAVGKTFYGVFTGNGSPLGRPFSNHDPIFFSVDLCVIVQPADIVASNDTGKCGAVVNFPAPATSGDCGTVTCSPPSGSLFPVGTTTVTCSSPGVQSVTFNVTVNDTEPPKITCPADIVVVTSGGSGTTVVNYPAPVVTDNCPGASAICVPPSGSTLPTGITTVTCTATDAAGNKSICAFQITVFDTCLKDDATGNLFEWSSVTGDYRFVRCSTGFTLTGKGTVQKVNSVQTLSDTKPDRRITANFITNQLTGHAVVTIIQGPGISQTFVINQTNPHAGCSC